MTTDGQISFDDTLDGGAGSDTLFIRDEGGATGAFTASNIETINARDDGTGATIELDNVSGYTTLVASGPAGALVIDEIKAADDLSLDVEANTGGNNVTFTFADDELDGTADAVSTKLSGNSGNFTLNIGDGNGTIETLNIEAATDNTGTTTLSADPLAVATVNISGSGSVDLSGGALTGTTISASAATGNVQLSLGAEDQTVTGGSGNDTFSFAGNLSNADTVDGGEGTDVLAINDAALDGTADGNVENVSNVETLRILDNPAADRVFDMAQITGLTNIEFAVDPGGNNLTVDNLLSSSTVTYEADATNTQTFTLDANTSNDNFTIILDDADVADIDSGNSFVDTLTINSITAANDIVNLSGFDADKIVVTGDQELDLNNNALAATVSTVDASDATGAVLVLASGTSTEMTGGSGNDNLAGGAGADVIDGGEGNDTLTGGAGNDTITAGTGNDTVDAGAGTNTVDLSGGGTNVVDFDTLGTTTITGLSDGDTIDIENDFGDEGENVVTTQQGAQVDPTNAETQIVTFDASASAVTTAGTETIADFTDTTDVSAYLEEGFDAAANEDFVFVLNDGADSYIYSSEGDADGDIDAGTVSLVGVVEGFILGADDVGQTA